MVMTERDRYRGVRYAALWAVGLGGRMRSNVRRGRETGKPRCGDAQDRADVELVHDYVPTACDGCLERVSGWVRDNEEDVVGTFEDSVGR